MCIFAKSSTFAVKIALVAQGSCNLKLLMRFISFQEQAIAGVFDSVGKSRSFSVERCRTSAVSHGADEAVGYMLSDVRRLYWR